MNKSISVVLPTNRDVEYLRNALYSKIDSSECAILSGELKTSALWTNYLRILNHQVHIVYGTRMAAFAPISDLEIVVLYEDSDVSHKEQRSPYTNSREVLLNRVQFSEKLSFVSLSLSRSPQIQRLVNSGFLQEYIFDSEKLTKNLPNIEVLNSKVVEAKGQTPHTRISSSIIKLARESLKKGSVLFVVPRKGYIPLLSCAKCHEITHCQYCNSPLKIVGNRQVPICVRCSQPNYNYKCPKCNSSQIRANRIGSERSAFEIGKLFPGVIIRSSSSTASDGIIPLINSEPQIVVATPGAIPICPDGYQLVVVLDAYLFTIFESLDTSSDALSQFYHFISFTKSKQDDGECIISGDIPPQIANSVVLFDPILYIFQELTERKELKFPPYSRVVVFVSTGDVITKIMNRFQSQYSDISLFVVMGPYPLLKTNYASQFSNWGKGLRKEDLQCLIIRLPIKYSHQLADDVYKIKIDLAVKRKLQQTKVLLDPKEFL
jgi:primosomal protein N' (replication factor Y)